MEWRATILLAFVALSQVQAHSQLRTPPATLNVNGTHSEKVAPAKAKAAAPVKLVKGNAAAQPALAKSSAPKKAEAAKPKPEVPTKAQPVSHEKAKTPAKKATSLVSSKHTINPPLKDVSSDKKFFGPPFPADYPDDKRPVAQKSIMDKLKGPDQPYPALQSKDQYDRDYVKDENSDRGDWKAQFEYDRLRRQLAREQGDYAGASDRADKEGRDVDGAQGNADRAGRDVDDARRARDEAAAGEDDAKHNPEDWAGPPSDEKLKKLKAAVADAEANYEKEKKEFEECKRQLEESKKILEDLKAKQAEMEQQLASETKLWMETKTTRLNAKKSKEEAAHSKWLSAEGRLKAAQDAKAETDKVLAEKKAVHEASLKIAEKEKADVEKARKELDRATLTLQKLRGYKPATAQPAKSGAAMTSVFFSFSAVLAMHSL